MLTSCPWTPPPALSNEPSPTGNEEHSQAPKPIEPYRVRSLKRRAHAIRFIRLRGLAVHVISRRLSEGSRNVFTAVEGVCVRGQDQGMRHFNGANTYSLPSSAEDAGHFRAVKILIYQCQGTMRFFSEFCVLVLCHFTFLICNRVCTWLQSRKVNQKTSSLQANFPGNV